MTASVSVSASLWPQYGPGQGRASKRSLASAETDSFPNDGNYAWGHVLAVTGKTLKRCSWMDGLSQWAGVTDRSSSEIEWKKDLPCSSADATTGTVSPCITPDESVIES